MCVFLKKKYIFFNLLLGGVSKNKQVINTIVNGFAYNI